MAAPGIATAVTYGADTSDSGGASVDAGGSADTKGSYTELSASTSAVIQALLMMMTGAGNGAPASNRWAVDLATGAGGAESVLIPDLRLSIGSSPQVLVPKSYEALTYIAASTRLAARAASQITDATDRLIDVAVLTGTAPVESSSVTSITITSPAVMPAARVVGY